jgi:PIN domain nuclease of toxin-antitoxin system
MKVLLDTHVMLWWWSEPERIPQPILTILSDPATTILASAVSAYEMAYMHRWGRLSLPPGLLKDFPAVLKAERWHELSLTIEHSLLAGKLPTPHRDPFDRLLGAQALAEKADFVTADPAFRSFEGLNIVW